MGRAKSVRKKAPSTSQSKKRSYSKTSASNTNNSNTNVVNTKTRNSSKGLHKLLSTNPSLFEKVHSKISARHLGKSIQTTVKKASALGQAAEDIFFGFDDIVLSGLAGNGWHYPGSHYIGPGTPIGPGIESAPVNAMDNLARIHDYQYSQLQEKGVDPYWTFNEADRQMLKGVDLTTPEGWAIYIGIGLKQILPDDHTSVDPVPPFGVTEPGQGTADDQLAEKPRNTIQREMTGEIRTILLEKALAALAQQPQQQQQQPIAPSAMNALKEPRQSKSKMQPSTATDKMKSFFNSISNPRVQPREEAARRRFFLTGPSLDRRELGRIAGGLNAPAQQGLSSLYSSAGRSLELPGFSEGPRPPRSSLSFNSQPRSAVGNPLASMQTPVKTKTSSYQIPAPFSRNSQGLMRAIPSFVKR